MRLRYEVYCVELGRDSPFADHEARTISDSLDAFGNTFIAIEDSETIGTLRSNLSREGDLGHLQEVYGMRESLHHPEDFPLVGKGSGSPARPRRRSD